MEQTPMTPLSTSASVVRHSVSRQGKAIITMELVYPRFIHSEFMTHRMFSRNAMSSRAVPVSRMIRQVRENPAMPIHWGANKPGMQAGEEVGAEAKEDGIQLWLQAAAVAANVAEAMSRDLGLHKQVANRILEPYQWMRTVVTATEWDNFFSLRLDAAAEPNMRALAVCMQEAIAQSSPVTREHHLPYFDEIEFINVKDFDEACMVSAARCARVSYLNHDGSKPDYEKDLALATMLKTSRHASPFEHIAVPGNSNTRSRNFVGWLQYRESIGL